MDKISYALGMSIANNFKATGIKDLNIAEFEKGMDDVLSQKEMAMTYEEAQEMLNKYFQKLQENQADLAKKAGEEFLNINKNREGVHVLPSGLQYEILQEGTGKRPTATDKVECHYEGTLIDGTVFDSSYKRGEATEFGVNQVIAGWTEALQLMSEGSKWRLFIPSDLAYGARGAGQVIGPHSTLIFDVELLKVK